MTSLYNILYNRYYGPMKSKIVLLCIQGITDLMLKDKGNIKHSKDETAYYKRWLLVL